MTGQQPRLKTRLTERLGLRHPILSAPMATAGGGALAAAVTRAGGLGLIGGGYGNSEWLTREFQAAGNEQVGCGFITWSLAKQPQLLDEALARQPKAIMLSFGDPRPFADSIHKAGAALICQCQTLAHVRQVIEAGASVIVAQGGEAGGHGQSRGTMSFVPEVADWLAANAPDVVLVAAGGIADGRGLAAALALGADGVLMGTRFWASREALVHQRHHAAILADDGDATIRSSAPDVARQLDWPKPFNIRVRENEFTQRWHGREAELVAAITIEAPAYAEAFAAGDPEAAAVVYGEAAGLISDIPSAGEIVARVVQEACDVLGRNAGLRN
ncbi:MAG: NAD(P)H-dependent flavin oxidoreductase [Bosea sp. (in: a-proteobacteria)]